MKHKEVGILSLKKKIFFRTMLIVDALSVIAVITRGFKVTIIQQSVNSTTK